MIFSTRSKIAVARQVQKAATRFAAFSGSLGTDGLVRVRRGGANWVLDLEEGIDLSIYLVGGFERATHATYRRLVMPGATCIDIGANIGSHTLPLATCVGESGRVIAIEPTAIAYNKMCVNLDTNPELARRVTRIQAMVTARDEDLPAPSIYASWPVTIKDKEQTPTHDRHLGVKMQTDGARAATLKTLVSDCSLQRIDLIKIDVDGYEMEVLKGAESVLKAQQPIIVMELAPYTWEEKGVASEAPIQFLSNLGYRFRDLSGKAFSATGLDVPLIRPGHSINIIAECG